MDDQSPQSGKCCCSKPASLTTVISSTSQPVADPSVWSAPWIVGKVASPVGDIPRVATSLTWVDRCGGWKVRWAVGRMRY